jgi:hypothetical protein
LRRRLRKTFAFLYADDRRRLTPGGDSHEGAGYDRGEEQERRESPPEFRHLKASPDCLRMLGTLVPIYERTDRPRSYLMQASTTSSQYLNRSLTRSISSITR